MPVRVTVRSCQEDNFHSTVCCRSSQSQAFNHCVACVALTVPISGTAFAIMLFSVERHSHQRTHGYLQH